MAWRWSRRGDQNAVGMPALARLQDCFLYVWEPVKCFKLRSNVTFCVSQTLKRISICSFQNTHLCVTFPSSAQAALWDLLVSCLFVSLLRSLCELTQVLLPLWRLPWPSHKPRLLPILFPCFTYSSNIAWSLRHCHYLPPCVSPRRGTQNTVGP